MSPTLKMTLAAILAFSAAALAQSTPEVSGEVKKIDSGAQEITLKHDRIPNLDMDAMTMVFKASDPAALKNLKAGDKVKFKVDIVNGELTVTEIRKSK